MRSRKLLVFVLLLVAARADAQAAVPHERAGMHMDFELDPTAYVLAGHSLHVGLGYGRARLDLGNFAIAMPQFLHGNDGFDVSYDGYGVKLQYFLFAEQAGLFAGVDGNLMRGLAQRQHTSLSTRSLQGSLGLHVGYRIPIIAGFYITPWIGVDYDFGARDVTLRGATYKASSITVFPAIHLGYRAQ